MSDGDIGEELLDAWGGDDPAEALRRARHAPTTTPPDELPRCPECESVQLRNRPGTPHHDRPNTPYWCENCETPVDTPLGGADR